MVMLRQLPSNPTRGQIVKVSAYNHKVLKHPGSLLRCATPFCQSSKFLLWLIKAEGR